MFLIRRGLLLVAAVILTAAPILALSTFSPVTPTLAAPTSSHAPTGLPEALPGTLMFGMAIRVKDAGTVARKWVQRAGAAGGDYKDGVAQAGGDWEAGALAGASNFAQGVQQAISDGRYEKGIRGAGAAKFVAKAGTVGAARFTQGVAASEAEMAKGVGPVLQAIASVALPPRGPKGAPQNMERANAVAQALRKFKVTR